MSEIKLLPCRFCGNPPMEFDRTDGYSPNVVCSSRLSICPTKPRAVASSLELARKKWNVRNTRTPGGLSHE